MKLNKSTRYALYAAMEMARAPDDRQITAAEVADHYSIPATVVAKVFQQLVRCGIAVGTRGSGGGYRLSQPASRLTVLDIVEAFEPTRSDDDGLLEARLKSLFDEVDELVRCTFASITLETLTGRPRFRRTG